MRQSRPREERRVSGNAARFFEKEQAGKGSPFNFHTMTEIEAGIKEIRARIEIEDLETEELDVKIETLKRHGRPEDKEQAEELTETLRKKRKSSSDLRFRAQNLEAEKFTFLESTVNSSPHERQALLMSILLRPIRQARGESKEGKAGRTKSFKVDLIKYYDAGDPDTCTILSPKVEGEEARVRYRHLWCPITKQFHASSDIIAAHIVPYTLGPQVVSYLLGEMVQDTTILGNGMLMHEKFEKKFDSADIVLVPDGPFGKGDTLELKLVLIDQDLANLVVIAPRKWKDFDGVRLQFRNLSRPQKRYLYLRYAMTMMHMFNHKRSGYEALRERIWPSRLVWATPDRWLNGRLMSGIIGEHLGTFDGDKYGSKEDQENLNEAFRAAIDAIPTRDDYDDDDDDEEDLDFDEDSIVVPATPTITADEKEDLDSSPTPQVSSLPIRRDPKEPESQT